MSAIEIMKIVALTFAYNVFVFAVFFLDRQAARAGRWRISERNLLTLALIGGSPGAVAGQVLLRHKTRKEPFRSILRLIVILHAVLCGGLLALSIRGNIGLF